MVVWFSWTLDLELVRLTCLLTGCLCAVAADGCSNWHSGPGLALLSRLVCTAACCMPEWSVSQAHQCVDCCTCLVLAVHFAACVLSMAFARADELMQPLETHVLHTCVAPSQAVAAALLHLHFLRSAGLNLLLALSCFACTVLVLHVSVVGCSSRVGNLASADACATAVSAPSSLLFNMTCAANMWLVVAVLMLMLEPVMAQRGLAGTAQPNM